MDINRFYSYHQKKNSGIILPKNMFTNSKFLLTQSSPYDSNFNKLPGYYDQFLDQTFQFEQKQHQNQKCNNQVNYKSDNVNQSIVPTKIQQYGQKLFSMTKQFLDKFQLKNLIDQFNKWKKNILQNDEFINLNQIESQNQDQKIPTQENINKQYIQIEDSKKSNLNNNNQYNQIDLSLKRQNSTDLMAENPVKKKIFNNSTKYCFVISEQELETQSSDQEEHYIFQNQDFKKSSSLQIQQNNRISISSQDNNINKYGKISNNKKFNSLEQNSQQRIIKNLKPEHFSKRTIKRVNYKANLDSDQTSQKQQETMEKNSTQLINKKDRNKQIYSQYLQSDQTQSKQKKFKQSIFNRKQQSYKIENQINHFNNEQQKQINNLNINNLNNQNQEKISEITSSKNEIKFEQDNIKNEQNKFDFEKNLNNNYHKSEKLINDVENQQKLDISSDINNKITKTEISSQIQADQNLNQILYQQHKDKEIQQQLNQNENISQEFIQKTTQHTETKEIEQNSKIDLKKESLQSQNIVNLKQQDLTQKIIINDQKSDLIIQNDLNQENKLQNISQNNLQNQANPFQQISQTSNCISIEDLITPEIDFNQFEQPQINQKENSQQIFSNLSTTNNNIFNKQESNFFTQANTQPQILGLLFQNSINSISSIQNNALPNQQNDQFVQQPLFQFNNQQLTDQNKKNINIQNKNQNYLLNNNNNSFIQSQNNRNNCTNQPIQLFQPISAINLNQNQTQSQNNFFPINQSQNQFENSNKTNISQYVPSTSSQQSNFSNFSNNITFISQPQDFLIKNNSQSSTQKNDNNFFQNQLFTNTNQFNNAQQNTLFSSNLLKNIDLSNFNCQSQQSQQNFINPFLIQYTENTQDAFNTLLNSPSVETKTQMPQKQKKHQKKRANQN